MRVTQRDLDKMQDKYADATNQRDTLEEELERWKKGARRLARKVICYSDKMTEQEQIAQMANLSVEELFKEEE